MSGVGVGGSYSIGDLSVPDFCSAWGRGWASDDHIYIYIYTFIIVIKRIVIIMK